MVEIDMTKRAELQKKRSSPTLI